MSRFIIEDEGRKARMRTIRIALEALKLDLDDLAAEERKSDEHHNTGCIIYLMSRETSGLIADCGMLVDEA